MKIAITRAGRVDCRTTIRLELSASRVWGQLRDFQCFAECDWFHHDVRIVGGVPRPGAKLLLPHRFGPFRAMRHGRIVRWREGVGFAFSDLSAKGPRRGFPHVFAVEVKPGPSGQGSELTIAVRGRWTMRWTPRWLVRLWLAWNFLYITSRLQNRLMAFQLATCSSSSSFSSPSPPRSSTASSTTRSPPGSASSISPSATRRSSTPTTRRCSASAGA